MSTSICQELSLNFINVVKPQVAQLTSTINGLISTAQSSTNIEELKSTKSKLQAQLGGLENYYESYTITQKEAEANGCQAVALDYARAASDIDALAFDADNEIQILNVKIPELEKQKVETTNNPQDPATAQQPANSGSQNQVNDDAGGKNVPGENQKQNVVPNTGTPVNVSASGSGQGSSASPGPSGVREKDALPGRRTYNPLSKLASYTYNFTLYMITPDAYDAFLLSGRKKIDALAQAVPVTQGGGSTGGAFVIAQSGGINNKTQTRAPGFELDYYIDNVNFDVITSQNQSGASAFTANLKMTIIEPYGFSFISNLKRALLGLQQYSNSTAYKDNTNQFKQFFILGLRFYGYDANGNLVKGTDLLGNEALDPENSTQSLFERFYDLNLQTCKFKLEAKGGTVYNLEFSNPGAQTMLGLKRGRITTGARCVGSTVKEMLMGPDGLLTSLNKMQTDQAAKNPPDRKIANTFDIKFLGEAEQRIGGASMVLQSDLNKWRWPGSSATDTSSVTDNTGIKAVPNSNARELIFNNDTAIIRAIGSIIQKSRFMEEALSAVNSNVVQPDPKQKNTEQVINNEPQQFSWYSISAEMSNIEWDDQLKDWAYKTTFLVSLYEVPSISTPFVTNVQKYYGPHKYYYYWLTGLNTEVLDFSLTFNNAYYNSVISTAPNQSNLTNAPPGTNDGLTSIAAGTRSGGDSTGSLNVGGEVQASVETILFSPESFTDGRITILGDPDFLMRDQVSSVDSLYQKYYDTDQFTVSSHGGLVYVEVVLKEAKDYKHSVGLQEVNESIQFYPYPQSVQKVAKGIIYRVDRVSSNFTGGKFTQTLTLRGAEEWPADSTESEAQSADANRETESSTASGQTNSSGASTGSGQSTSANTGQRSDPALPKQQTPGNDVSQSNLNTVGNQTPLSISTNTGQVADDDGLAEVTIQSAKKITPQGREGQLIVTPIDLIDPGPIDVPPPIINLGRGRG